MKVTRIGLKVHPDRDDSVIKARQVIELLQQSGIQVSIEGWVKQTLGSPLPTIEQTPVLDAMISLGGDGTFLRAAETAIERSIPLLGINMGRVGFLTEAEMTEAPKALLRLAKGEFSIEKRMLLDVRVNEGPPMLAVNDAVVNRGGYTRLISIDAHVSTERIGRYIADGVIVATPTGSTGYSLSAGGPIISPGVPCMVITPVCAHTLQHRPVVVQDQAIVNLQLRCDQSQGIVLTIDGRDALSLSGSDRVRITRAEKDLQLIRTKEQQFFGLVRNKLTEWSC